MAIGPANLCTPAGSIDGYAVSSFHQTPRENHAEIHYRWLKPGAFVAAVGTSLPSGRELDDHTLARAARIVVEWKPQSLVEAGEIVLGKAAGSVQDQRLVDLPEIFSGLAPWRIRPQELVVFKAVGVGLTDLAAAAVVWQQLGNA